MQKINRQLGEISEALMQAARDLQGQGSLQALRERALVGKAAAESSVQNLVRQGRLVRSDARSPCPVARRLVHSYRVATEMELARHAAQQRKSAAKVPTMSRCEQLGVCQARGSGQGDCSQCDSGEVPQVRWSAYEPPSFARPIVNSVFALAAA